MKTSVLVTGGAGFMGSHIAEELCRQGYAVVIIDDLSGGFKENLPDKAHFFEGNILDMKLLDDLFKKYKFKYVFHLAAYAAEGLSHFIKRFNYTNNVIGSMNLINQSINHNIDCFVFTSSIAVYGSNQLPLKEEFIPSPQDSYGIAKFTVEQELKICKELFDLNYIIFRPHNVYGERQNIGDKYRNVIGIFMNNILAGEPVQIFGDGKQSRAFSYIMDIAPIIAGAVKNKDCYNQVFNIGADKAYTINELADMVIHIMGKDTKKEYLDFRHEAVHAYSDHNKLKKFFNFKESVSLEDGLSKMARWVKKVGVRQTKKFENIEILKNIPKSWLS